MTVSLAIIARNGALFNNDLSVPPGFLAGLANGLRARPDHLLPTRTTSAACQPGSAARSAA